MITKILALDKKIAFIFPKYYHHKALNHCMIAISGLGDFGMIWIAIVLLLTIEEGTKDIAQLVLMTLFLATIIGQVTIKSLVKRKRPCQRYPEVQMLVPVPHDRSFPSGHTTSSFACATVICCFFPIAGILCLLFASVMAFSRIYLFVHYLSDVVFAMLLGIMVGLFVVVI